MTAASFPHRVVIIGEPLHARAEGEDVILYGPNLRHAATIPNALRLLRELVVALRIARRARARLRSGERTGPAPTGADPASAQSAIAPHAAKPVRDAGPSVHLFAPALYRAACLEPPMPLESMEDTQGVGRFTQGLGRLTQVLGRGGPVEPRS